MKQRLTKVGQEVVNKEAMVPTVRWEVARSRRTVSLALILDRHNHHIVMQKKVMVCQEEAEAGMVGTMVSREHPVQAVPAI